MLVISPAHAVVQVRSSKSRPYKWKIVVRSVLSEPFGCLWLRGGVLSHSRVIVEYGRKYAVPDHQSGVVVQCVQSGGGAACWSWFATSVSAIVAQRESRKAAGKRAMAGRPVPLYAKRTIFRPQISRRLLSYPCRFV